MAAGTSSVDETVEQIVAAHAAGGTRFDAAGVESFALAQGEGEPVVLLHGLPTSSYLYRKVIPELAERGFRALSFDLPGLGLAARPPGFDYTFAGLGRWATAAVRGLDLGRFHLVVHDAGGPVGFELAAAVPDQIRSLTLLNTVVAVDSGPPFVMELYARFATGERWPAAPPRRVFRELMYRVGIRNRAAVPAGEVDAHRALLLRSDNGRAYLKIMRNVRRTAERAPIYKSVVDSTRTPYPVQIIWGADDPVIRLRSHGWRAREAARLDTIHALPGRHYLQEDFAPEIAKTVGEFASRA